MYKTKKIRKLMQVDKILSKNIEIKIVKVVQM